jgi:hypothetical protein
LKDHPRLPKKMDLARDLSGRVNLVSPCLGTYSPEEMLSIRDKAPRRPEGMCQQRLGLQAHGCGKKVLLIIGELAKEAT